MSWRTPPLKSSNRHRHIPGYVRVPVSMAEESSPETHLANGGSALRVHARRRLAARPLDESSFSESCLSSAVCVELGSLASALPASPRISLFLSFLAGPPASLGCMLLKLWFQEKRLQAGVLTLEAGVRTWSSTFEERSPPQGL